MTAGNGSPPAERVPLRQAFLPAYAVLQGLGAGLLLLLWGAGRLLKPWIAPELGDFGASWAGVFILVPVSFVPALMWWHGWVCRRYGERPRAWRLVAELAFALQVVACLILRGIA